MAGYEWHLFVYHPASGLLTCATSRDRQQVELTYDGSLLTAASWSGVVTGTVSYTHNNDFRAIQMAYGGVSLPPGYDRDVRLTNIASITLRRNTTKGFVSRIADGAFAIASARNEYGEATNMVASQGTELYQERLTYDALERPSPVG